MKFLMVAVTAATSYSIQASTIEILEGPEVADVLLPEIAHAFGANLAVHSTFDDLKIKPEDVHILPRAPNLEDALGALAGAPLTRQPKPYSHSMMELDASKYDAAQIKIAEARAAELVASLAPKFEFTPGLRSNHRVSLVQIEIAPGQYGNVPYIVFNSAIYALLLPLALFGLRNAKTPFFITKLLPAAAFFLGHNVASIVLQNILSFRGVLAVPFAGCFGLLAMLYAFRRVDSCPVWSSNAALCPCFTGLEKEPMGWVMCERIYLAVVANLSYHAISSVLPYRLGFAGVFTSNIMIAGLLYFLYLVMVALNLRIHLYSKEDIRRRQNLVMSLVCSYIAISAFSFFVDIVAVYYGFGDFIAFDPPVFFSTATVYELNIGTVLATLAFLGMWGASYQELKAMDDQQKAVLSTASLAVGSYGEASTALFDNMMNLRDRGFEM